MENRRREEARNSKRTLSRQTNDLHGRHRGHDRHCMTVWRIKAPDVHYDRLTAQNPAHRKSAQERQMLRPPAHDITVGAIRQKDISNRPTHLHSHWFTQTQDCTRERSASHTHTVRQLKVRIYVHRSVVFAHVRMRGKATQTVPSPCTQFSIVFMCRL